MLKWTTGPNICFFEMFCSVWLHIGLARARLSSAPRGSAQLGSAQIALARQKRVVVDRVGFRMISKKMEKKTISIAGRRSVVTQGICGVHILPLLSLSDFFRRIFYSSPPRSSTPNMLHMLLLLLSLNNTLPVVSSLPVPIRPLNRPRVSWT